MNTAQHTGLSVQGLACRRHDRLLFENLQLRLQPGEVLEVCGPNGAGKTSLLRLLCGLRNPDAGVIEWLGQSIEDDPGRFRNDLCYVGHRQGLNGDLSASENLRLEAAVFGLSPDTPAALQIMGLPPNLQELPTRQLSAGQRQRASLARLLIRKVPLWILDEPIASLDREAQTQVIGMIAQQARSGGAVAFTTHQPISINDIDVRKLVLGETG